MNEQILASLFQELRDNPEKFAQRRERLTQKISQIINGPDEALPIKCDITLSAEYRYWFLVLKAFWDILMGEREFSETLFITYLVQQGLTVEARKFAALCDFLSDSSRSGPDENSSNEA